MAVRPLIGAGVVLSSAGLLIASLPTIAPPLLDREIRTAADAQTPSGAGSGFPIAPSPAPVEDLATGLHLVEDVGGPDAPTLLLADPSTLQTLLDAFFIGYPTSAGPDGFTGVAYFAVDQIFPDSPIIDAFFEGGFTEVARVVLVGLAGGEGTPLGGAINDFFEGGVTQLVGTALVDALPDDSYAHGVTDAFFFGYSNDPDDDEPPNGIVGATYYTLTTLISGTPPPVPDELAEPSTFGAVPFAATGRIPAVDQNPGPRVDGDTIGKTPVPAVPPTAAVNPGGVFENPVESPPASGRSWRVPTPPQPGPEPAAPPTDAAVAAEETPEPASTGRKPAAVDRTKRNQKPAVDMTTGNKTTVEPLLPFGKRPGGDPGNRIRDTWKRITDPSTPARSPESESTDEG